MNNISVILLAGGKGTRMKTEVPKQYLELSGKPLISYSFDFFKSFPHIKEIIIVCEEEYRSLFETSPDIKLKFAMPGVRRQDSVQNGLKEAAENAELICIHDGARPFLEISFVSEAINQAAIYGAATVAVPLKFTVKEKDENGFIKKTLDRSKIYEIQTPQVIRHDLLKEGFKCADENRLDVTDDVSLVELLGKPVKLVTGSYQNIKITTEEDFQFAEHILDKEGHVVKHEVLL